MKKSIEKKGKPDVTIDFPSLLEEIRSSLEKAINKPLSAKPKGETEKFFGGIYAEENPTSIDNRVLILFYYKTLKTINFYYPDTTWQNEINEIMETIAQKYKLEVKNLNSVETIK